MLYHNKVYLPEQVQCSLPRGAFLLCYSQHAIDRAAQRRVKLPIYIKTETAQAVEVETNQAGKIIKILYRLTLTADRDLCIVVLTNKTVWRVKTVWVNDSTDNHGTLDKSIYCTKERSYAT